MSVDVAGQETVPEEWTVGFLRGFTPIKLCSVVSLSSARLKCDLQHAFV